MDEEVISTDELCELLDESWQIGSNVFWLNDYGTWMFAIPHKDDDGFKDGFEVFERVGEGLTAEQAIAATVGRGTCHIKEVASYGYPFECSECKAWYGVDVPNEFDTVWITKSCALSMLDGIDAAFEAGHSRAVEYGKKIGRGTCHLEEIEKDCDTASEYMLDREWCFDAVYRCSCGCRFGHVAHNRPRFCPNCGAKVVDE